MVKRLRYEWSDIKIAFPGGRVFEVKSLNSADCHFKETFDGPVVFEANHPTSEALEACEANKLGEDR